MLKKILGALGTTAAVFAAGQASAGALGAPNEIFIGGATAVQETFNMDILVRFCDYDGNTNDADGIIQPRVFVDSYSTLPGAGDGAASKPTLRHGSEQAIYCTFKNSLGGNLAGANVAVYKFNGGSGTGVAPVANPAGAPTADQGYMDASLGACPQVNPTSNPNANPAVPNTFLSVDGVLRFTLHDCSSTRVTQAPDGGISDVEPKMFVGELATGFGQSVPGISPDKAQNDFVDTGNLIVKAGPGIVFGVAVTLAMYDELIDDQNAAPDLLPLCPAAPTRAERDSLACMPSIPSTLVASAFTGEISRWTTRRIYDRALSPPAYVAVADPNRGADGSKVNICRRTAGSGTNAQFQAEYLRTNCINGSPAQVTFANDVAQTSSSPQVYENEGSSDIDKCMNALNAGTGYNGGFANGLTDFPNAPTPLNGGKSSVVPNGRTAYGMAYNSLERNSALDNGYRFVKIDGVPPTLQEAYNGNYRDIYFLSYQNRILNGNPDPQLGAIRTVAADATEIEVHREFFAIWNSPDATSVDAVNDGLIVDPDSPDVTDGDEWQGGLLVPARLPASHVFAGGPLGNDPRTPWTRETTGGSADSCQPLTYKN